MTDVRSWAPGRTELAGNHTDHQGGRVIAATLGCRVNMELHANGTEYMHMASDGFTPVDISLADMSPIPDELFTTAALVRGVVAGLREAGVDVRGFDARVTSDVPAGGGLSSSAAFELALGSGLNLLFGGALSPHELAFVGQAAERNFFGKPCGLMDQLSIALGGTNLFDFGSPTELSFEHIPLDLGQYGYALCLVNTGCDHSAYTDEYARVATDMGDVAHFLGADVLSQVSQSDFLARFDEVRAQLGDLPALRGLHYYNEMRLVDERAQALREGDFAAFLAATRQSGASSAQFLQNVSTFDRQSQPAMVALALATTLLGGRGAARIHGGGFGGSIQTFVPLDFVDEFTETIDSHLGAGACRTYEVGSEGAGAQWA